MIDVPLKDLSNLCRQLEDARVTAALGIRLMQRNAHTIPVETRELRTTLTRLEGLVEELHKALDFLEGTAGLISETGARFDEICSCGVELEATDPGICPTCLASTQLPK
jgi:hypothetical protein